MRDRIYRFIGETAGCSSDAPYSSLGELCLGSMARIKKKDWKSAAEFAAYRKWSAIQLKKYLARLKNKRKP